MVVNGTAFAKLMVTQERYNVNRGPRQLLNKVRLFGLGSSTEHRIVTATDIDNPKFEVVLLPTVGASSFLHDFLDRYLFAIAFHQLRHRNIGCVTALTFK